MEDDAMSSKIEQAIDDIIEYIDNCSYKKFSSDTILVNKADFEEYLEDLKKNVPEEIARYQKIISNKEAILNDARKKAQELINEATVQTNELISEHQIMQQAYAQANEIVELASKQAQEILDTATIEANEMKTAAMQYTDDILANLENIIKHSIETSTNNYNQSLADLQQIESIISSNRAELAPQEEEEMEHVETEQQNNE